MATAQGAAFSPQIAARIERLPLSAWHVKIGLIIGSAWFFDGFDALAIAYVLPVIIGPWHIAPCQIGLLISSGYRRADYRLRLFRLARRAHRPRAGGALRAAALLADEPRLRVRLELQLAVRDAVRPGPGSRRRDSDHRRLYQRIRRLEAARQVLVVIPGSVLGRPVRGGAARALGGAGLRLAMDVRDRRRAGGPCRAIAAHVAGIAALARESRPARGGRCHLAPHRGHRIASRAPAAAAGAAASAAAEPAGTRFADLFKGAIAAAPTASGYCGCRAISSSMASPPGCRRCGARSITCRCSRRSITAPSLRPSASADRSSMSGSSRSSDASPCSRRRCSSAPSPSSCLAAYADGDAGAVGALRRDLRLLPAIRSWRSASAPTTPSSIPTSCARSAPASAMRGCASPR